MKKGLRGSVGGRASHSMVMFLFMQSRTRLQICSVQRRAVCRKAAIGIGHGKTATELLRPARNLSEYCSFAVHIMAFSHVDIGGDIL